MRSITITRICGLALLLAVLFLFSCDGIYIRAPEFYPQGGYYLEDQLVTIGGNEWDRETFCYYTLDGSTPDENSLFYYGPFVVELGTTVTAIAITSDGFRSVVVSATYSQIPDWLIGYYEMPDNAGIVAVADEYAYVIGENSGFHVIDIHDPANPASVGTCTVSSGASSIAVSGDYAYIAAYYSINVIDISDSTHPVRLGFLNTVDQEASIAVDNNRLFLATKYNGLYIYDLANPAVPALIGSCSLLHGSKDIAISGDRVYTTNQQNGLSIIDISDAAHPLVIGWFSHASTLWSLEIVGNSVFVAGTAGLIALDISDPYQPLVTATLTANAREIAVANNRAYMAEGTSGMRVVDISNPYNLIQSGVYYTGRTATGVAVSGNLACLIERGSGLSIIDIE